MCHHPGGEFKIGMLNGRCQVISVLLYLIKNPKPGSFIQKHAPDNFRKNTFGNPGSTCIIKQPAVLMPRMSKQPVRHPPDADPVLYAGFRFQQLDTRNDASILVLPASSC